MEVAIGSEIGVRQHETTDAHLEEYFSPDIALFGVADGFGTLPRNQSPATLALGSVSDYIRRRQRVGLLTGRGANPNALRAFLLHALEVANSRLYAESGSNDDFVTGGASLTTALIVGRQAFIAHVGDARAYLFRLGRLESLTADDAIFSDHTAPATKSLVPAKPRINGLLWRCLGTQPKLEASIAHVELLPGDQLMLCTDGLHRSLFLDEIGSALVQGDSSNDVVSRLLMMTKVRGAADSATILVGRDLLIPAVVTAPPAPSRSVVAASTIVLSLLSVVAAATWFLSHH